MVTGVYAARNIMGGNFDVWAVNTEKEYHEEGGKTPVPAGDRMVPSRIQEKVETQLQELEEELIPEEELIQTVFAKIDPVAMGVALGTTSGFFIFLATAILILQGGPAVGPNLSLLGNYLYGFTVTWNGALVGLLEGGLAGFAIGYWGASFRNWGMRAYAKFARWREEAERRRNLLDKV